MDKTEDIKFWLGRVVNTADPEYRRRIQVRIFGIHDKNTTLDKDTGQGLPDDDLPWCICMFPANFGGLKDYCPPPAYMKDAVVLGISLDGQNYQNNIVLGSVPCDKPADFAVNNSDADITTTLPDLSNFASLLNNAKGTSAVSSTSQALSEASNNITAVETQLADSSSTSNLKDSISDNSSSSSSSSTGTTNTDSTGTTTNNNSSSSTTTNSSTTVTSSNSNGTSGTVNTTTTNLYKTSTEDNTEIGNGALIKDLAAAGIKYMAYAKDKAEEEKYTVTNDDNTTEEENTTISYADTDVTKLDITVDQCYTALINTEKILYGNSNSYKTTGERIYNMIKYLKENDTEKYQRFTSDFGLSINFDSDSDTTKIEELLIRGMIKYFSTEKYSNNLISASLATYYGSATVSNMYDKYGVPSTINQYILLAEDLKNDEYTSYYKFLITFIKQFSSEE